MARSIFISVFVGVLLIQSAWTLALPMFRGPDEIDHLLRSSNVALGHWQPDQRLAADYPRFVIADGSLAASARQTCETLREDLDPEICTPRRSFSDGTVEIRSFVAEYNPAYYAIAGLPLRVENSEAGAWAVRALGAFLSALLIAWAWSLIASRQATRWPIVALLIATPPATFFATTVAAPNGLGYAAGLLLWAGLLTVWRHPASVGAALGSAVGAGVLVLTHPTGFIWVGASVLTVLVLAGWAGLKDILTSRPVVWIAGTALVATAITCAAVWNLVYEPNAFSERAVADEPLVDETKAIPMVAHVVLWVFQTVGVMPNRFGMLWLIIYALWLIPLVMLIVHAARRGDTRVRVAGALALSISVLVPAVATALTYEAIGVGWQGRYELPLLVGIPLIAGVVLDRGQDLRRWQRHSIVLLLAVTQFLSLLCLGLREASGPYDDGRPWGPLLWVVAPMLITAGYLLLSRAGNRSVEAE